MPIIERDPWRMQYFENVECPDDVIIPTDDEHAYELYPEYRWIYNKLLICDTQGVEGAPHGVPPSGFPVFSKPIYNMHGMGVGGRLISDRETLAANLTAGHMWMELMEGEHISSDVVLLSGPTFTVGDGSRPSSNCTIAGAGAIQTKTGMTDTASFCSAPMACRIALRQPSSSQKSAAAQASAVFRLPFAMTSPWSSMQCRPGGSGSP